MKVRSAGLKLLHADRNEAGTYVIETSFGNALRIVFRPQNMEEILFGDVLMFQTVCVVCSRSQNTPRLLMSLLLIAFLLTNLPNLFPCNVLTSFPTRSC